MYISVIFSFYISLKYFFKSNHKDKENNGKYQWNKSCFFSKINKIDKPLARFKNKLGEGWNQKIKSEKGEGTHSYQLQLHTVPVATETQRVMRD